MKSSLGDLRPLGRRNGEERHPYKVALAGTRGLKISIPADSSASLKDHFYAYEIITGPNAGSLVFMKGKKGD